MAWLKYVDWHKEKLIKTHVSQKEMSSKITVNDVTARCQLFVKVIWSWSSPSYVRAKKQCSHWLLSTRMTGTLYTVLSIKLWPTVDITFNIYTCAYLLQTLCLKKKILFKINTDLLLMVSIEGVVELSLKYNTLVQFIKGGLSNLFGLKPAETNRSLKIYI